MHTQRKVQEQEQGRGWHRNRDKGRGMNRIRSMGWDRNRDKGRGDRESSNFWQDFSPSVFSVKWQFSGVTFYDGSVVRVGVGYRVRLYDGDGRVVREGVGYRMRLYGGRVVRAGTTAVLVVVVVVGRTQKRERAGECRVVGRQPNVTPLPLSHIK
ncbi:hypothetical protein E2C01_039996 [Portunus trituberculatus]|uniref:Uncharacterized protein n=1 Tax=Portunus trituberculatus TaxID=210409 RepID=A0A5B7FG82_PORTR|nr:hypothetical protein [Portunus trituberculatus]